MNKNYWKNFYKKRLTETPSSFTEYVNSYIQGDLVDLGCGNGRDLLHFIRQGIHATGVDEIAWDMPHYIQSDVSQYIKTHQSPDSVYTRFFWHAIDNDLQKEILKWTKNLIFIEARTTQDRDKKKIFDNHDRNFVSVPELVKNVKEAGFDIIKLEEGLGFSKYKTENPHLVRLIAKKI
jgi:tellurite methyltransferase